MAQTDGPDGVIWQIPSDAADFLSGRVPRVGYHEPLELGELGPLVSDPAGASPFDGDDE